MGCCESTASEGEADAVQCSYNPSECQVKAAASAFEAAQRMHENLSKEKPRAAQKNIIELRALLKTDTRVKRSVVDDILDALQHANWDMKSPCSELARDALFAFLRFRRQYHCGKVDGDEKDKWLKKIEKIKNEVKTQALSCVDVVLNLEVMEAMVSSMTDTAKNARKEALFLALDFASAVLNKEIGTVAAVSKELLKLGLEARGTNWLAPALLMLQLRSSAKDEDLDKLLEMAAKYSANPRSFDWRLLATISSVLAYVALHNDGEDFRKKAALGSGLLSFCDKISAKDSRVCYCVAKDLLLLEHFSADAEVRQRAKWRLGDIRRDETKNVSVKSLVKPENAHCILAVEKALSEMKSKRSSTVAVIVSDFTTVSALAPLTAYDTGAKIDSATKFQLVATSAEKSESESEFEDSETSSSETEDLSSESSFD